MVWIRPSIAVLAAVVFAPALAAAERLQGVVVDDATDEPVPGAIVQVGGAPSTAAISDIDGSFELEGVAAGDVEVVVIADGYAPYAAMVSATARAARVVLRVSVDADGEVIEVVGTAPVIAEPPRYELSGAELRTVPGAGNDALKSVQTLPGVARVPFGAGGLVLRGASPRDSNVFLDGIEVPILFHFGGLASFYPSALIDSAELVPSGFGPEYGRARGGIVTLRSRAGRDDRWRAAGEVSLIDASARADGPALGGTVAFGIRRSYVDVVLALALPEDSAGRLTIPPRYYDAQFRYDVSPTARDSVTVLAFGADDRIRLGPSDPMDDDPDGFEFGSRFLRLAARWQRRVDDVVITAMPWVGVDQSEIRVGDQGSTRTTYPAGLRASVVRVTSWGQVAGGLDVQGGRYDLQLTNNPPPMPGVDEQVEVEKDTTDYAADVGVWLEGLYRIEGGRLALRPGVRAERFGVGGAWAVDPRLTVSHALPRGVTLEESVGLYHQPAILADKDWGNPSLRPSYAVQGAVGARVEDAAGVDASVTGFASEAYDLAVDVVSSASPASAGGTVNAGGAGAASAELLYEQFGAWSYRDSVGRGRAYGVEVAAKRATSSYYAWLSYTWSRSLRRDDPTRFTGYHPYILDQPHLLTALGSVALGDNWRLGARLRYATGNPYTPSVGTYFDSDEQEYRPVDGAVLSARLPAFFQLDVRLDRRWRRSWGEMALFIDVQNATNRLNAEGVSYNYDYSELEYTRGLPIFPSIGLEYTP